MVSIDVEGFGALEEGNRFFQERRRLAGEHRLVDDTGSFEQEDVGRDAGLCLMPNYEGCVRGDALAESLKRTDGYDVSREKLIGLQGYPSVVSQALDRVRRHGHRPELSESPQTL